MRALVFTFCLPATAFAGAYDGLYRPNYDWAEGWDCTSLGADGGALGIQNDQFIGVENSCDMTNEAPVPGMDATFYDLTCTAEGEQSTERVILMPSDDGIYVIRDGFVVDWKTCS